MNTRSWCARACAMCAALLAVLVTVPVGSASYTVPSSPSGPSAPSGGWSVAYADGFGAPLGTGSGQDNTLFPHGAAGGTYSCSGYSGPSNPSSEQEAYACNHVVVNSSGLKLSCTYTPNVASYSGYAMDYTCGEAEAVPGYTAPSGYKFFRFRPGDGQTWVIQYRARYPYNTGEADNGFWASNHPWTQEIDWFEAFGWGAGAGKGWCNGSRASSAMPTWIYNTGQFEEAYGTEWLCHDLGFNPASAMHTYTVELGSDNTFSAWVDGKPIAWTYTWAAKRSSTVLGPIPSYDSSYVGLIFNYAIRTLTDGRPDPYFESGTRSFRVRYVEVFENASANFANTINSGVAPGTTR